MKYVFLAIAIALIVFAVYAFVQSKSRRINSPSKRLVRTLSREHRVRNPIHRALAWRNSQPRWYRLRCAWHTHGSTRPYQWQEHMLDGGNGSQWLSVEMDEGQLDLVLWQTRKGLNLDVRTMSKSMGSNTTVAKLDGQCFTPRVTLVCRRKVNWNMPIMLRPTTAA